MTVIYGWFNEEQGNLTCAVNSTFAVEAQIPLTADFNDGSATVTGLTIASTAESTTAGTESFEPQFYNLTDSVAGQQLNAGDSLEVAFNVPLNGAFEMDYSFLITMSLETASGDDCTGSSLFTFTAGGLPDLEFGNDACEAFLAVYEAGQDGGGGGGGGGGGNKDKDDDKDNDKNNKDKGN